MEINIRDGYRNEHKYEEVQCGSVVMRGITKVSGWFPGRKELLLVIDGVAHQIRPDYAGLFLRWRPLFKISFPEGDIEIRLLGSTIRIDCPQLGAHLVLQCPNDFWGRRKHKDVLLFKDHKPVDYCIQKSKEIVKGKGRRSNLREDEEAEEELIGIEHEPFRRRRSFEFTPGTRLDSHEGNLSTTLNMLTFYQLYWNNLANRQDSITALTLYFP